MTHFLSVHGLSLSRGDSRICSDFSMQLVGGECIHLLGSNGSGKTSLMQALVGLLKPDAGTITWSIGGAQTAAHYCAHQDGLKAVWTVAENMHWYLRLHDMVMSAAQKQKCLETMRLAHLADTPVAQLSQGQKRRCALLRLWLMPRPVWLLDEPFNALDTEARDCLASWINEHTANGGAVLFSSHSEQPTHLKLSSEIRFAAPGFMT